MEYSEAARTVIERLRSAGESAYLVGGCVRDMLLGITPHDFDVTTSARPERILGIFSGFCTIPTGIRHGTVTVMIGGEGIEVTTYRIDGEYTDFRRPRSVEFTDRIGDDLARRDFTINAMAYNDKDGLIDLYGGSDDLARGIIRCVGDAEKRFGEDALRILRAFRFSARYGFEIEEKTFAAAAKCAPELEKISAERKQSELSELVCAPYAAEALLKMRKSGVDKYLFLPEAMPDAENFALLEALPKALPTRLGMLFWGIEPDTVRRQMRTLKFSNEMTDGVSRIARGAFRELGAGSLWDDAGAGAEAAARRFLYEFSAESESVLQILEVKSKENAGFCRAVRKERAKNPCVSLDALALRGEDILALGVEGREVGRVLALLLDAVIEGKCPNTKDELISFAGENIL